MEKNNNSINQTSMDEQTEKIVYETQAAIMEIFEIMVNIFDKYNLKYSLVAGSLLGALRHKGFIPWDDDLDIIMPRDDYNKFKEIAKAELPDHFFFQDYATDSEYPSLHAKIRNSNTTLIENGYRNLKKMHHGIFVDVFIADEYNPSFINDLKRKIIKLNTTILGYQKIAGINKFVKAVCNLFPRNLLFKITDNMSAKIHSKKEKNQYIFLNEYIMPEGIFDDLISVPFENINAKISGKYDALLSDMYGDYMKLPPMERRAPRHMTKHISTTIPCKEYIAKYMH